MLRPYQVTFFAALGVLGQGACERAAPVADAPTPDAASTPDDGSTSPGRVALRATAIASGRYHSCALLEDQRVKCWGENDYGQLGLGDTISRGLTSETMGDALPAVDLGKGRHAMAIAAGHYATCAILDDGSVKCWGAELTGLPDFRGDEPGEMGDALPAVDIGVGHTATRIAVGYYTACALRDDAQVVCWPAGTAPGQIALPSSPRVVDIVGTLVVTARFDDGSIREISDPGVLPTLSALGVNDHATMIGNGNRNSCAGFVEHGVVCTEETNRVPPFGARNLQALAISQQYVTCGLTVAGDVSCWGGGNRIWGEPQADGSARVKLGRVAVAIAGGAWEHTCALLVDGSVKCWDSWDDDNSFGPAAWLGGSSASTSAWPPIALGTRPAT